MSEESVNPGNIQDELIDNLLQNEAQYVIHLIEGTVGSTVLKRGNQIPLSVAGRKVDMIDRLMSDGKAKNINEFFSLLDEAISDRLMRENITEKDKLVFTEDYPPVDIRTETISYCIKDRYPALTGPGKAGTKAGRQDWKRKLRAITPDPDHPNKKLYIYGQLFDNMIELSCWARTSKVANQRALWLEQLMSDYTWFFKYKGVSEVRFTQRMADSYSDIEGNRLHCRPLRFFVRTERISYISEYTLADLVIRARLAESISN